MAMSVGELAAVAAVASAMAALFSALIAAVTNVTEGWRHLEGDARRAIAAMHEPAVARARSIVGRAARCRRIRRRDRDDFISAAFTLMWVMQSAQFQFRPIRKSPVVVHEGTVLYGHLEAILTDLAVALERHGWMLDWLETGERTNAVLDTMPTLRTAWWRTVARPPAARLPVPAEVGDRR